MKSGQILVNGAFCTLLIAWSVFAAAEEKNVNPEINRHYQNPNFSVWVQRFESEGREVYDKRLEIVAATGVKPGMHVADVGAGTGLFTKLFSPAVGTNGKVYAVDISAEFIKNIRRIAQEQDLNNVETVINTQKSVSLPENSVDIVFVCNTYHHFEYPQSMLASIKRALRKKGRLIIVDYKKIKGQSSKWVMNHIRDGKRQVIKEITRAGFNLTEEKRFLTTNYYIQFTNP